jgi:hypothetical protein
MTISNLSLLIALLKQKNVSPYLKYHWLRGWGVLLIILRSPVITLPVGLYTNGELAHVQSGGLDLKLHHIRSKLFSLPLSKLHTLYNSCLVSNVINPNSNEYKLTAIVLDNADHRLFKPVGIKKVEIDKRSFLSCNTCL